MKGNKLVMVGGKTGNTEIINEITCINEITEYGNEFYLREYLIKSRDDKLFLDVCFKVADKEGQKRDIFAHKCVLAARNEYFIKLFEKKEEEIQNIEFTDLSYEALDCYIHFLYSLNFKIEKKEIILELLN